VRQEGVSLLQAAENPLTINQWLPDKQVKHKKTDGDSNSWASCVSWENHWYRICLE